MVAVTGCDCVSQSTRKAGRQAGRHSAAQGNRLVNNTGRRGSWSDARISRYAFRAGAMAEEWAGGCRQVCSRYLRYVWGTEGDLDWTGLYCIGEEGGEGGRKVHKAGQHRENSGLAVIYGVGNREQSDLG